MVLREKWPQREEAGCLSVTLSLGVLSVNANPVTYCQAGALGTPRLYPCKCIFSNRLPAPLHHGLPLASGAFGATLLFWSSEGEKKDGAIR